jgi:hypothetical protein
MDSRYVLESIRWRTSKLLRKFWNADREAVAHVIRELLEFDVPAEFEGQLLVQRTDINPEDELLLLLHRAGDGEFNRRDVGQHARVPPTSVTRALQKLSSQTVRTAIKLKNGHYRLTDLGSKDIRAACRQARTRRSAL